jgi:anti-sigma factor RsiW
MNAHEQWIERLSDYADGEISPSDRSELESHLASCDECARALEEIRGVITTAHGLEDRAPETDLWPAIEARLESGRILGRSSRWFGRRFHVSFPQLAAAALALVLLSAGGMWVALHGHSIGLFRLPDRFSEPSTLTGRPTPGGTAGSALAAIDFASYDQAVAELERVLRENRERLDPSTLQVVEKNLAIIDRATEDARLALARDPGNPYLGGYLADQMKRKIRVLKQATDLLNTQS